MANRATALGRADLKYIKILYSSIKASKEREQEPPPWGLRGGVQGVFNIPNPLKVALKIN